MGGTTVWRSVRRRVELGIGLAVVWPPRPEHLRGLLRSTLTSFVALGVTIWLLPTLRSTGPVSILVLVVAVAVVGTVLRPLLLVLAVVLGPIGLLVIGVVAQAIVLDVSLAIVPSVRTSPFPDVLLASWIAAAIVALVNWLFDASSEDAYLAQVLGRAVQVAHTVDVHGPGLLVVQLDGVSEPLLRQALRAGAVPTLSRWLRSGTHHLRGWDTGLPSTTPAGQAVLLHGDARQVPSFRWYEKDTGRLMVANRPRDAAEIERRISDGRGLLADDGVSVSNLFSGDAPLSLLTMSDVRLPARTRGLATFATSRRGLIRSLLLFVGEMLAELQQGRRQRRRDVRPRVRRRGVFVILRAVTTVLLRDLNVSIVAEQMARGAPVIFVDFVDYDEVAHHAGPSRPEAMRTLDGLDRVLWLFERVASEVGRDYELVVVSDHGQAQGVPFAQAAGTTLGDLVATLCSDDRAPDATTEDADSSPAEHWGPATLLLTGAARSSPRATRGLLRSRTEHDDDGPAVILGRPPTRGPAAPPDPAGRTGPIVAASGGLAHVYFPDHPDRLDLPAVEQRAPGLIAALAAHDGIGVVLGREAGRLVAIGRTGRRVLDDPDPPPATDPLAAYGPGAAAALLALERREHVGDLVLLGALDPRTDEVTAFEELVGSHGGLGGGQTSAVLLHPSVWDGVPDGTLSGRAVHLLLMERLAQLGLRQDRAHDDITVTV